MADSNNPWPETNTRPSMSGAGLSVLLLAQNNASEVAEVVAAWGKTLQEMKRPFEIILLADGSGNATPEHAAGLTERWPTLTVLRHDQLRGLGAALRTGLAVAKHPLLVTAPANKQFQPAELQRLLQDIDKVDLVTGYRVGQPVPGWLAILNGLYRLTLGLCFGIPLEPVPAWLGWREQLRRSLCQWLFGVHVHDPACAFRLYRRQVFARLPIQSDGNFAQVEILAKANFLGCLMAEVPVTCLPSSNQPSTWLHSEILDLFRRPVFGEAPEMRAEGR